MSDLISIIVPVYNVKPYLEECLDSIINQTYKNLEIIIVDDGSTDGCSEICDKYQIKDKRIKVFHTKNHGLSAARNVGLNNTTGQYIGFVDSDDVIDKEMYNILYKMIKRNNAQVAECGLYKFRKKSEIPEKNNFKILCYSGKQALEKNLCIDSKYPAIGVWNKLYEKNVIRGLQFPEGKMHEDYLFTCRALYNSDKYCFVDKSLYFYRNREGSITNTKRRNVNLDKLNIVRERTKFLQDIKETELAKLSEAYEYVVLFSYFWEAKKKNIDIAKEFEKELKDKRRKVLKSYIPFKRKVVYLLFYVHPSIYLFIRNILKV